MKKISYVILGCVLTLGGCGDKAEIERLTKLKQTLEAENRSLKNSLIKSQPQLKRAKEIDNRFKFLISGLKELQARLVTNQGTIQVRFFPEDAPLHCLSFIARAEGGFYNGTQFHRVIPGFMIQGGDPNSKDTDPTDDGAGGPVFQIPHEFNKRRHMRGVLSTARVGDPSFGAGSQFFIMHGPAAHLDNQYTIFGEVTKGMDVVDRIATTTTYQKQFEERRAQGQAVRQPEPGLKSHPVKPVIIRHIEISKNKGG